MISPPLGDFRHMAHVGRGADDMFGDTTFLQNQADLDKQNGGNEVKRTSSFGRKKARNHSVPDENGTSDVKSVSAQSYDGYGQAESPILQSAFSLPLLPHGNASSTDTSPVHSRGSKSSKGKGKKTMNNNCISNGKSHSKSYGNGIDTPDATPNGTGNGPPKPRRIMDDESSGLGSVDKQSELRRSSEVYTHKPGSMLNQPSGWYETSSVLDGWNIDLGCSLMDDVLGSLRQSGIITIQSSTQQILQPICFGGIQIFRNHPSVLKSRTRFERIRRELKRFNISTI
uniref:CRIB domain-containing protein n=1 Tax=Ciona savignyi TaxID=51511 RepID=H2ZFI9_CIOSA